MKKETKKQIVKGLESAFAASDSYYLVDFKRMKVSQSVELRKLLRKNSYSFRVVKNRLALRALQENCPEEIKPLFDQPTAVAFAPENPIGLARILRDFSAQGKVLAVKAGVLEGQYLPSARFDEIAKLASRQELIGRIGLMMASPLTRLLRTFQAPLGHIGNALGQLEGRKQDGSPKN